MELSRQKQTEAKKLGVSVQYLVLADLMAAGYTEQDAYTIAYPENEALAVRQNASIRTNITGSAKFKKLLEERLKRMKEGTNPVNVDDVQLVDTETVMKEILRSARHQPMGTKERADLFAKYNEIKTKAEQGVEDETEAISFVFPLKCSQCPLLYSYNEYRKENGETDIKPVEMTRIMSLSHKIIKAAIDAEE